MDSADLRNAFGNFATGVTVATMSDGETDHGMTVNSFSSVSLDPPLVLYSADESTKSYDFTAEAGTFAINVLGADQEWLSNRFAGQQEEMDDPFHDVETRREETGALVFEDAVAYFDCSVWERYDGGDHAIYVGAVEDYGIQRPEADVLTFLRGDYGDLP
ncbi:flavin reductase family protein [Halobacteriales archaeon Cl-PHB]